MAPIVEDFSGQAVLLLFSPRSVWTTATCANNRPTAALFPPALWNWGRRALPARGGNPELQLKARPQEDAAIIAEALRQR